MRFKIFTVAILTLISGSIIAQGPYPPAAGQEGSTAIYYNSPDFVCWGNGIQLTRGYTNISAPGTFTSFGYPAIALGMAQESSFDVVSLGDAGEALLTFDRPIVNGDGFDFAVFENGFDDTFLELAFVEVSSDGVNFVRFPSVSLTPESPQASYLDPTNLHNLAGKYRQGYGTPFDLEDLIDSANIDLQNVRFVKVIDVVGSIDEQYATYDSQGHIVNDPWPTDSYSGGFDLDAVGVINAGEPYTMSDFNDLSLSNNSYWNGSDGSGMFTSGNIEYVNNFDATYYSWAGFSYSNMTDNTTPGYENQFSAYTRGGMDAGEDGGTNYGIAFVGTDWQSGSSDPVPVEANIIGNEAKVINGFYATNATYSYLSMLNGDSYAKKFGGDSGNDPDYFKLIIYGIDAEGNNTEEVEFYLADYRFDDNSLDYIVDNWRWVELSSLGKVTGLRFYLESSDASAYGINTPTYFCIDNIYTAPVVINAIENSSIACDVNVYPNPSDGRFTVETTENTSIYIYDMSGRNVFTRDNVNGNISIDLSAQTSGVYILTTRSSSGTGSRKLIVR